MSKEWSFTAQDSFAGGIQLKGRGEDADTALLDALQHPVYVGFRSPAEGDWQHLATRTELAYLERDDSLDGWFAEYRWKRFGSPQRVRLWIYGAQSKERRSLLD
jgi:hypothetical protein